jgi:hypothetical protein
MIFSSADIYRTLVSDAIIGASARVRIAEGRPSLELQDGIVIYVSQFAEVEDFEALWHLWIVDFDDEPLDIVLAQLRRLFPSFNILDSGTIVHGAITEIRTARTETRPELSLQRRESVQVYIDELQARFLELEESIQDRMLLVQSGKAGKDGVNGKDGRDGKDLVATDVHLGDLRDVAVDDVKKDQVLTFDGTNWIPTFASEHYPRPRGVTRGEVDTLVGLTERGEPMGHTDRNESTINFDNATRTFTITPVGTSFRVWVQGKRYMIRKPLSVQIPDETGLYFIYFGDKGVLGVQEDYFYWNTEAPTAYVYWDAESQICPYFAEERHGIVLDWQTHEYLHRTRGAAIANGFDIANYIINGNGTLDAHAQFDLGNGTFFDEDLKITVTHSSTPEFENFQQDLQGPARIPVLYKLGNTWKIDQATNFPLKPGTVHPYYNLDTLGVWSLAEVDTNKYINYYIIATNNLKSSILSLMGQVQYSNQTDARNETFSALHLTDFPSKEFRFLYKITYRTANYTNAVNATVVQIQDLRQYSSLPFSLFA